MYNVGLNKKFFNFNKLKFYRFISILFFIFAVLLFFVFQNKYCFSKDVNETANLKKKEIEFLHSIKDLKADFIQKQYDGDKVINASGRIFIKKPDKIMIQHHSNDMKLKIVSINGNVKVLDEDLQQTTYFDNQYSELLKFFSSELNSNNLLINNSGYICLNFIVDDKNLRSCLDVDLSKTTINKIIVYILEKKNKEYKELKIMDIVFSNVLINNGVSDKEFIIKDTRIFDDEEL